MRTLLFISFIFITTSLFSQKWVLVAEDDKSSAISIDEASLKIENGYAYIWVKNVYNDEEYKSEYVDEYLKIIKKYEYPTTSIPQSILVKWIKFKYTLYYQVYDLQNYKSRTISIINYANDGSVLSKSEVDEERNFEPIEQESLDAILYEEILSRVN